MKPADPTVRKLEHIADELRTEGKTSLAEEVAEVIQQVKEIANRQPSHQSREDVMTTGEAARLLGIRSINTIKRWAIYGLLEGYRRGVRILVSRASVERLMDTPTVADQKRFEADQDKALDAFDLGDDEPLPLTPWPGRKPWEEGADGSK